MIAKKLALVLATFGTTREQEVDLVSRIKEELEARHPGMDVFIAFTSKVVAKERRKKGQAANALAQVLSELSGAGYTHVAVQSLHVVPGMEFDMLKDIAGRFAHMPKGIVRTVTGPPLIYNDLQAARVADILVRELPQERQPDEAVIFIGHGAKRPAGTLTYPALQAYLWRRDPRLFVGTVEGSLDARSLLEQLQAQGLKKAWLVPLLAYYGVHAAQDIFGGEASWQHCFESGGIACVPERKTLLARPAVTALWVENAVAALEALQRHPEM